MSRVFYARLAVSNMKKNRRFTLPYLLTGVFLVMMFYINGALAANPDLVEATGSASMLRVMNMSVAIVGIFSVIMLFYADSFMMKRRKKELGLYNILGMEKKHIGRTLFWETVYAWIIAVIGGFVCGLLFSKLVFLIAEKMLNMKTGLDFYISFEKMFLTIVLFGLIYLVSFVFHLIQLKVNRPVELLRGGSVGEREPKTKWVIAVAGAACLVIGYYLAITIESPIAALNRFFVAVLFVIAGTYLTFTAGTIALLKVLRKNRKFYYQTRHFSAVSGLIYRMKQNAVGLSSICILATMVLVLVSTTFSLYKGVESGVENQMLRNAMVEYAGSENLLDSVSPEEILKMAEEAGYETENPIEFYYGEIIALKDGDTFLSDPDMITAGNFNLAADIFLISAEDYKILTGKEVYLEKNHALAYSSQGETMSHIRMIDQDWTIDGEMDMTGVPELDNVVASYAFVVPDREAIWEVSAQAESMYGESYEDYAGELISSIHFDVKGDAQTQTDCVNELKDSVKERLTSVGEGYTMLVKGKEAELLDGYQFYGAFFFIGIFLAIVFMMGTVLIIYYKQLSEGYEDRERFRIMQNVGMSHREVRQSIRSQILIVFFLPLAAAAVHIAAAFPMIKKILACFNYTDASLFGICTVVTLLAFAAIYAIVYSLTAKVYYGIVTTK